MNDMAYAQYCQTMHRFETKVEQEEIVSNHLQAEDCSIKWCAERYQKEFLQSDKA